MIEDALFGTLEGIVRVYILITFIACTLAVIGFVVLFHPFIAMDMVHFEEEETTKFGLNE